MHDMTPGQRERSRVPSPRPLTGEQVHDSVVLRTVGRSSQNLVTVERRQLLLYSAMRSFAALRLARAYDARADRSQMTSVPVVLR